MLSFALRGSLNDLVSDRIPIWSRNSVCSPLDNEGIIRNFGSSDPVFINNGQFLLEPSRVNLATWNMDLLNPIWTVGSNIFLQRDRGVSLDVSRLAQMITFSPGTGVSQTIRRSFFVPGGTNFVVRVFMKLVSGQINTSTDYIEVSGGLVNPQTQSLGALNNTGDYQVFTFKVKTEGSRSDQNPGIIGTPYPIQQVTQSAVTVRVPGSVANSFTNSNVSIASRIFSVVSNTQADDAGDTTLVLSPANIVSSGITASDFLSFIGSSEQILTVTLNCDNAAAILFGGIQVEEGDFPTSTIFQYDQITPRAASELYFQPIDNPVYDRRNLGVYGVLGQWAGDGNLLDFGNLKIFIENGILKVIADAVTITDTTPLPEECKFLAQINQGDSSLKLYVDGILKASATITGFSGDYTPFTLTSSGMRLWDTICVFTPALRDLSTTGINQRAQSEVGDLFSNPTSPISPSILSRRLSEFSLPPTTVPANGKTFIRFPVDVRVESEIVGIDPQNNVISVLNNVGFATEAALVRSPDYADVGEVVVSVVGINNTLGVNSTQGLAPGQTIAQITSETLVSPSNYSATIETDIQGVKIETKAPNGVIVSNATQTNIRVPVKIYVNV